MGEENLQPTPTPFERFSQATEMSLEQLGQLPFTEQPEYLLYQGIEEALEVVMYDLGNFMSPDYTFPFGLTPDIYQKAIAFGEKVKPFGKDMGDDDAGAPYQENDSWGRIIFSRPHATTLRLPARGATPESSYRLSFDKDPQNPNRIVTSLNQKFDSASPRISTLLVKITPENDDASVLRISAQNDLLALTDFFVGADGIARKNPPEVNPPSNP